MSAGRRTVLQGRKLEEVSVKEKDQFLRSSALAAGGGHGCDMVGHFLLLEAGEIDKASFAARVAQETVRTGRAMVRGRWFGRIGLRVAMRLEPLPEGRSGGRVISAQRPQP